jgi:hypothetical protein
MLSGQGSTLFAGINAVIGLLVAIQLWLVSAALEALFSNEISAVVPGFLASLFLFIVNAGLYAHGRSFDRRRRAALRGSRSDREEVS